MPDINLLQDTKIPDPGADKQRAGSPRLEYTRPGKEKNRETKPDLPSPFWQKVRSWFAPQPRVKTPPKLRAMPPLKPVIKSMEPVNPVHSAPVVTPAPRPMPQPDDPLPARSNLPPLENGKHRPAPLPSNLNKPPVQGMESDPFQVNLLPDELAGKFDPKQKSIVLAAVVFGAAAIITLSYLGLSYYKTGIIKKTEDVRIERSKVEASINGLRADQKASLAFKNRTDTLKTVLDHHIYWTKFFSLIEKYTDPEVAYGSSFVGDVKGQLALQGTARSVAAVARQMLIFDQAKEFVSSAVVTGLTAATRENGTFINFNVQLTLAPGVFSETAAEFQAQNPIPAPIPSLGNVTAP